ncbi:hypothetical protein BDV23DRAFT_173122 [Aspergillus alliaceus]|uniref:LysM domain-containing protein n=1 Tax=Petromyces alliaceus TaxID=209559 RepID=A0A5N7C6Z2_PETAA|nr:hypothetical protein BDV23DRAFT_173122 [Aspergillus alliaceus]
MVGKIHVANVGLFGDSGVLVAENDRSIPCEDILSAWGITLADFWRWNPSITKMGGNLLAGCLYYVKVFEEPVLMTAPSTTTTQPARRIRLNRAKLTLICTGIKGWTPTGMTSGTTLTATNRIPMPSPLQPDIIENCNKFRLFHMVVEGDECHAIANSNGITMERLVSWNPEVKTDCSSLWLGYYICGKVIGLTPSPATTTGPTEPTNGIETPTPILPGMVDNCDKFHMVVDDDQCGNIAQKYSISRNQFTTWNPQIGSGCSGLWLGYYVCVKIIGVAPTTTTTTTLYAWNTQIGTNCGGLWAGYYVCVSIVGANPKPTTTTTGNGIATPTPTQTGMTGNCKKFTSITLANFYSWNTGVGSSCQTLWLGYYICTGVK